MSKRAVVLVAVCLFLCAFSVLGEVESGHISAHIVYGLLIPLTFTGALLTYRRSRSSR